MIVVRNYKDQIMQRIYNGYIDAFESKRKGWIAPAVHGLWREDGSRFRGASGHSAFWNGYDSIADPNVYGSRFARRRSRYVNNSPAHAAYMAGRDCAKSVAARATVSTSPCQCCGKRVRKRVRAGKARHAHLCPHGRPCPAGHPLEGVHINGPRPVALGGCAACAENVRNPA